MDSDSDYLKINQDSWNRKTDTHMESDFYNVKEFLEGKTTLKNIELNLLDDLKGKSILHLQCHFGLDTLSLARMGGTVTGVDLSDQAIHRARELAKKTNLDAKFINCDLYDLPNHLNEEFDIVYTTYGTIGWLPDIDKWGQIVSDFLKPGGKLIFVEFHPVVWMFDNEFSKVEYNYFNSGPIEETETGTYANRDANLTLKYVMWNHSIGEVITSLLNNGLELTSLEEYDYSPYNCFKLIIEPEPGKYRIKHLGNKIPMVYSIEARKKNSVSKS
ncbi:MAG: class I SAM-dependent methyltransferase [Eudoraea sp.]|uniref:class I SAM-dependent methyltransferase n=1 Tax=Eudoraea sp. TaxID=1979955 RepID=UPI003C710D41